MEDAHHTAVVCVIDGCDKPRFCREMCSKHYSRWQRHGDPHTTKRNPALAVGATDKVCPRCANRKPLDQFDKRPNGKPKGYCRDCELMYQAEYRDTPRGRAAHRRASWKWSSSNQDYFLQYRYGITIKDYEQMLSDQGGKCAICGTNEPDGRNRVWSVDHCHNSNKVRGLLCGGCNRGLGQFRDDPLRISAAYEYLMKHQEG